MQVAIVPVTPFAQNCSIVMCPTTGEAAVIDPGGELDRIIDQAQQMGATISKILLTHAHIDHAGGAAELSERLHVEIIGPHKEDQFWIDALDQQSKMFGFPKSRHFTPSRWLEDGDEVQVGDLRLKVVHTPGHTPGHVVFFCADEKIAFVGDVLFHGSIGRTDFPRGDHATLICSITEKLWPLGEDMEFVPGHGPTSSFGEEMQTNPFVSGKAG